MIAAARRYFAGRVARRLFLLFVLSAFAPLAVLAVMSYVQLRETLQQQGDQRLAAMAKGYGTTLFERLLLAADLAAASATTTPGEDSLARRTFRGLERIGVDGRAVQVFGAPSPVAFDEAARARLEQGRTVLLVLPGGTDYRLFIATPLPGGRVALGELQPEAFWQPEMLPASTDLCVLNDSRRAALFCSAPMPEAITHAPVGASAMRGLEWSREGEPQRAVLWSQYLRVGFGVSDWVVVASQPESVLFARLADYRQVYLPVVVLALLLVAWLTIRQSRSVVEPLRGVAARARAIARGEFKGRVAMARADEFGELSRAIDDMSGRLGRQFAALTALSEIDQLILSTLDTVQVVRTVVERMSDVVPADFVGVVLYDANSPNHAHAYSRDVVANDGLLFTRVEVAPSDRATLEASRSGAWLPLAGDAPGLLAALRDRGVALAYVQAIVWRNQVCGALALGYRAGHQGSEEERGQVRDFADRVAVAVSSAWRDEQLYQQAHFDSLTGLPNRMFFKDRLGHEIARCRREEGRLAVLFIDIDGFKNVNDTLGHSAGDQVLREAARRISTCVRASDTVSRLGGDEFTALLTGVHRGNDAGRVAEQIVGILSEPFEVDGQRAFLGGSVGIAIHPEDGATPEDLLRSSDTAMYRAKARGRAQIVYFEQKMNADAVARVTLDRDLRQALANGEMAMHYQPQVDLATGEIRGAEALMRWEHPEHGPISPSRFIPVAEESGLIEQLGRFALEQACAAVASWRAAGLGIERVSVNISPRQLRNANVVEMVKRCAKDAGLALEHLEIEITEGLLIDHAGSVEGLLRKLHVAGVRIALDDFGTGFSSMAYLNRFPIHTIKIDRAFVHGLGRSRDSEAIVAAIVAMSHALGKSVIAEGVETAEQLERLRRLGCDEVQGFHFARPMPHAAFEAFVRDAQLRAVNAPRTASTMPAT